MFLSLCGIRSDAGPVDIPAIIIQSWYPVIIKYDMPDVLSPGDFALSGQMKKITGSKKFLTDGVHPIRFFTQKSDMR